MVAPEYQHHQDGQGDSEEQKADGRRHRKPQGTKDFLTFLLDFDESQRQSGLKNGQESAGDAEWDKVEAEAAARSRRALAGKRLEDL